MLNISLPAACGEILQILETSGFSGYAVGGCVRDSLLGRVPHDWDIATDARPEEILRLFPDHVAHTQGVRHGTVALRIGAQTVEVTTFRLDGAYSDGRRPDSVTFTHDLREDLARRDFTVNAMAYRPKDGLHDLFGGLADLTAGVLRAVGEPERRFSEDALRLLRAVRFSAELGFSVEAGTLRAMERESGRLRAIAVERVFAELCRTVAAPHAARALRQSPRVLFSAVPELESLWNVPQNSIYHVYDVWEHTLHALENAPQEKTVRLAVLFHDVGKKAAHSVGEDGRDHFYGHAIPGAEITDRALTRLRAPNALRAEVVELVRLHDMTFPPKPVKLRRLLAKLGYETAFRLLAVSRADSAAHAPEYVAPRLRALDETERAIRELREAGVCLSLDALAVGGSDLLALGFSGPAIGNALSALLSDVIDGRLKNEREALLRRAERLRERRKL